MGSLDRPPGHRLGDGLKRLILNSIQAVNDDDYAAKSHELQQSGHAKLELRAW